MYEYLLMKRDDCFLEYKIEERLGGNERCVELQRNSSVMPIGFKDINDWVMKQNFAKHKEHLKKWLKEWGIDTLSGFLEISHRLSLNDTLWVKRKGYELTWKRCNLYENEFTDIVSVR